MTHSKLADMTKGWFVGDFAPTAFCTRRPPKSR